MFYELFYPRGIIQSVRLIQVSIDNIIPFKWTVEILRILPETLTIYVFINSFIKGDQLNIVP